MLACMLVKKTVKYTFQGPNISHLGKRKNNLKKCLGRGYVSSQEGTCYVDMWKHVLRIGALVLRLDSPEAEPKPKASFKERLGHPTTQRPFFV